MKIFIRTFGCAHNQADSEMMAGQLEKAGHELVDDESQADLVLFNSCTVKDPSQKRFFHEVEKTKQHKKVVVAGCVPQGDPKNPLLKNLSAVGVKQLDKVVDVVQRTQDGEVVHELKKKPGNAPLLLPTKRSNPLVAIIPVNSGCLGKCTFCKTKHARGHLSSWRPIEIIEKAKLAIADGAIELWLTSEDLGAYGRDIGTNIVELTKQLVELPGDFKIRLGMANPPLMHDIVDGIIELLNHPKVYKFIHIPVQAGSDKVLQDMQREYNIAEFESLVHKLQEAVPDLTIATDIIVGFPGETEADFEQTMSILEKYKFPIVNSSKFYARPGTPAATMKAVQTHIVKKRSKKLHDWIQAQNPHEQLGGRQEVVFTQKNNNSVIGKTHNYLQIIADDVDLLGTKAEVEVGNPNRYGAHVQKVYIRSSMRA